jgi:hypothetical protein
MLALLRRIRGARRVPFDTTPPAPSHPRPTPTWLPTAKRACGPAGLLYTEASLKQSAAIAAP